MLLVKGMASGNLVEAYIMVKRCWFLDLVFGKGPTQSIITLQEWVKEELQESFVLVSLPFDQCDKSCKILPRSIGFWANRNVWLSCYRFY